MANPDNVKNGLKGVLNNPKVSAEARERATRRLENDFGLAPKVELRPIKNPQQVRQGMESALNNPNVSEHKKQQLRNQLGY